MKAFADLLERLLFSPGRNVKIALLRQYFATRPDPERGYALAALAGALDFPGAKSAVLRAMAEARTDAALFALSYDFVGDLAETIALIWPKAMQDTAPELPEIITALRQAKRQIREELAGRRLVRIKVAIHEVNARLGDAYRRALSGHGRPGYGRARGSPTSRCVIHSSIVCAPRLL